MDKARGITHWTEAMNRAAVLELRAEKKVNKTIVADCFYEGALKITRPVYLDGTVPTVYLIHVGGGFVDGDCYRMKIDLDEQSHLALTTQSSTKVYRTPMKPVRQLTEITLKKGSVLEYFPDPLIAYKDSRFLQETTIHKEEGAILFLVISSHLAGLRMEACFNMSGFALG
nr:urease accessory protein UreD [Bacillus sp. T3]